MRREPASTRGRISRMLRNQYAGHLNIHAYACILGSKMNTKLKALPCYCATLRQAARAITSIYEEAFAGSGVYSTQYTILQLLRSVESLGTTELAGALGVDQTTATRMLALVSKEGLVETRADTDGRKRTWRLTAEGDKTVKRLKPLWDSAQGKVEKVLGRAMALELKIAAFEGAAKLNAAR